MATLREHLLAEIFEFGHLEDTRENIEAPIDQLNEEGKFIAKSLHAMGITTREQVDQLCELISPKIYQLIDGEGKEDDTDFFVEGTEEEIKQWFWDNLQGGECLGAKLFDKANDKEIG